MKLPKTDQNINNYYDLVGGQPAPASQPVQQQYMQNLQSGPTGVQTGGQNGQNGQRGQKPQNGQPRRPLNDEERRRLDAARQAAIQSGRISEDDLRRRRAEQQILRANQPQAPGDVSHGQIQPNRSNAAVRRKKRRSIRLNAGVVLFAVLIAGVLGVSAWQIRKNDVARSESAPYTFQEPLSVEDLESDIAGILADDPAPYSADPQGAVPGEADENAESGDPAAVTEAVPAGEDPAESAVATMTVQNSQVDEGTLILVNYQYPYNKADTVKTTNAYEARAAHAGKLKISSTDAAMEETAFAALEELVKGLEADTGCDDLMINSGYRTVAEQQRIYDSYLSTNGQEYVDAYVAIPGFSEHHTGLACDLTFYLDEGYSVPISEHEYGFWMANSPVNYGFIRRYPEDKVEITHISYEPWHFRYVGLPHAYACSALNFCLEEYLAYLQDFTADTKLLYVKTDSTVEEVTADALPTEGGWLISYTPMAEGDETVLSYPNLGAAEVSGDNMGGFIVTVTLP